MLKKLLLMVLLACPGPLFAELGPGDGSILLVAADNMPDPRFAQTVVLVANHNHNGPVGVIINRPLTLRLHHLFPDYAELNENNESAFYGGPVASQTVVFIMRAETQLKHALHVFDDVYLSLDKELFEKTLQRQNPADGVKVFLGYAGWTRGQLQKEIDKGDWHVITPDLETIYSEEPGQLWEKLSSKFRGEWVNLSSELQITGVANETGHPLVAR